MSDERVIIRRATNAEQRAALIDAARRAVGTGAGHECAEWLGPNGYCELCDGPGHAEPGSDAAYLRAIFDAAAAEDERRLVALVREFYGDLDRADRTDRGALYLHIGMLCGTILRIADDR